MASEHVGLHGVLSLFPTPEHITHQMLDKLPIKPGEVILEPSAGNGAMVKVIKERFPDNPVYVIERDPELRLDLFAAGWRAVSCDFFHFSQQVDWVIQNPPFSNDYQDINHFCHAWRIARKGVVSLLHEYSGYADWGKPRAFQNWFLNQGIRREMLPANSFLDSQMPSPVSVCMLWGMK